MAPGCPAGRRGAGFTLIELMVVIVVIGVLLSIFTLSVGGFAEDDGREEVRRMAALVNLATEEAGMQGREIGLTFYQHGYEFAVREAFTDKNGQLYWDWIPLETDRLLRPRDLGENLTIDLEIDGDEVTLAYERNDEKDYEPQVYLLSSGEIEPVFQARVRQTFENDGTGVRVTADGTLETFVDEF